MMDMDDKLIGFLYAVVGAAIALLGKWAIDAITRRSEKSNHACACGSSANWTVSRRVALP